MIVRRSLVEVSLDSLHICVHVAYFLGLSGFRSPYTQLSWKSSQFSQEGLSPLHFLFRWRQDSHARSTRVLPSPEGTTAGGAASRLWCKRGIDTSGAIRAGTAVGMADADGLSPPEVAAAEACWWVRWPGWH